MKSDIIEDFRMNRILPLLDRLKICLNDSPKRNFSTRKQHNVLIFLHKRVIYFLTFIYYLKFSVWIQLLLEAENKVLVSLVPYQMTLISHEICHRSPL